MPSASTWAAVAGVVFAAVAGGYYIYSKQLHLSVSAAAGAVNWSASGGTPNGAYTIALGGLYNTTGNFDANGKASGTLTIPPGTPPAQYEVVLVDETASKFVGVWVTIQ